MTSAPNIYIFKNSTDGEEFEKEDAIGPTQVQKDAKNANAIIYEGSAGGNDIKLSNSKTSNSKHQNFKTSNKSEFSNKQTENKENGYDSSTSFNTLTPLTPPLSDAVKSSAIRNISSKFEPASLSNKMENINNAGDISKYINALMDENNSRQSSLIQNKIKVFQGKIERKGSNKDETVRKSNANLSLIKKDFRERREHKDLATIKNTDVVLNKDEGSILIEDESSILNKDKDSNWNREGCLVLRGKKNLEIYNNRSGKKNIDVTPFGESKKIYTFTYMTGETSDWIKKDGLQCVSVAEAKKVLLLNSVQTKPNGYYENLGLQSVKRPGSSSHSKSKYNGHGSIGYNDSYNSEKSSSSSKSSQIMEITDIQIITRKEQPSLETKNEQHSQESRNQPIFKANHPKISNDVHSEPKENTTTSVKSLIEEFTFKKRQNPMKSSTWRGRPKSTLISSTSIMSFSGQQGSTANVKNDAVENDAIQLERKRRKSLNIDLEIMPTTKNDNLSLNNQLPSKQKTLPIEKELRKPQNLWNGYSERKQIIRGVNGINPKYTNERSTPNQRNSYKFQNGNSNDFVLNNSSVKSQSKSPSIQIPPTPPSSPQNDPLSPSQFSIFSDYTTIDPAPKYAPKKEIFSPSSAELKNTLKKELEKKLLKTKNDEIEVTEGMSTNSLNEPSTANPYDDSYTDVSIKSTSTDPQNKSLRYSIASGREKYEISFEYKMKEYETKDKITKKWDQKEKRQNEDSQFAASMRKLKQDDALSKMILRANGPPKGKKFVPRDGQTENDVNSKSLSYAYHIGEKTKEEREFEEGWVSVSDATKASKGVTNNKKEEPPVDYDVTYEENKSSTRTQPPPPPPPPPPHPITSSSSHSSSSPLPPPHIPLATYSDAPVPPPPSNNRSQRSTSSSGVDNRRKSDGFNLQPGIENGGHQEDKIKKAVEESKISKKDELLRKEPNPDYD